MSVDELSGSDILARCMDVTTRIPNAAAGLSDLASGGLLIERLIGRYVLNSDSRTVWALIDGTRTVQEIAAVTAATLSSGSQEVRPIIVRFLEELLALGLVELQPRQT